MQTNRITALDALDITSDQTSEPIKTSFVWQVSVVGTATGSSPNGTLKLQGSNDSAVNSIPVNWVDIPSATVTVNAVGQFLVPVTAVCFEWIQVVWTKNTGTGTITANVKTNG